MNKDAKKIIDNAIAAAKPNEAVEKALAKIKFKSGKLIVVAAGKAAYEMGKTAAKVLGKRVDAGIIITKYEHAKGKVKGFEIFEAGHPVPDENSFKATSRAIDMVSGLEKNDNVLFLLSGGGSALFEKPLIDNAQMQEITKQLLASGADIVEMNTIRKRLSAVKGGRFALNCEPASVFTVVLSDIIGDPLDMIASGPAYPDSSTSADAKKIVSKYSLKLSDEAMALMASETPKKLSNVETFVTGSVKELCKSAVKTCKELGYKPVVLTDCLSCEASEAGTFLGNIAKSYADSKTSMAFIAGGETVVHLKGKGKGGRNQEIALSAAQQIAGLKGVSVFSFGSDGTDGPTDAAGGYVDGNTASKLKANAIEISDVLANNDAYNALKKVGGLIMTGPTGTNVNDLAVVLVKR